MFRAGFSIAGRVQGVGFRAFVADQAQSMDIDGEVWNTRDGRVEVLAQHVTEDSIRQFEVILWRGPGRVDNVARTQADSPVEPGFRIGPTR
jgi:acylphosphatase